MLVIPANAGIQEHTGFRVKPGMTITKRLVSLCIKMLPKAFDGHPRSATEPPKTLRELIPMLLNDPFLQSIAWIAPPA